MRITNQMMVNSAITHMSDSLERLNQLNERVATGKQFQTASDDPVAASYSLSLRSTLRTTEVYRGTAEGTDDWMSANEFAFQQMEKIGIRAQNLVQRGLNDTMSPTERASALGVEMEELLQQALDAGNMKHNGQYIFAGYKTDTQPFSMDDPDVLVYDGDNHIMKRTISPGQVVSMGIDGEAVFRQFFESLAAARNALNSSDMTAMPATLTAIQSAVNTMDEARTSNGARQRQVQSAVDYMDKITLEVKSLLTSKEDVNMAEAISKMRGQETAYQSVLEVGQRAISALNLFDYLG
jgi:flagellar hook-associated protein 3 FlgL